MSCTNIPQGLLEHALAPPLMMIFDWLFVLLIDRCGGQFPGETETPGGDS